MWQEPKGLEEELSPVWEFNFLNGAGLIDGNCHKCSLKWIFFLFLYE